MCRFCDPNRGKFVNTYSYEKQKGYPYQDFSAVLPSNTEGSNLSAAFSKLYIEATGDGKRFTYYKLILPWEFLGLGYYFEHTNWINLASIWTAKNTLEILKAKLTIDEIIFSILLEETQAPLNESVETWTQATLFPAVGAVLNIKSISIIPMESTYYNFVTCHWESHLRLIDFVLPFQWHVWLVLFASIWLTTFTIPFVTAHFFPSNNEPVLKLNQCSIFVTLSLLLSDTIVHAKEFYGNIRLRPLLSLWFLASIILTNAYKGHTFSKTTAPSKGIKVEKFSDLTIFKIFSKEKCNPILVGDGQYCCEFGADLISWLWDRLDSSTFFKIASNTVKIDPTTGRIPNISFLTSYEFKTKSDGKIASLLPHLEILPNDNPAGVYQAIRDCNSLAYVGKGSEIKTLIRDIPSSCEQPVYAGKDKLFEKTSVWYIQANGGNYLIRRFRYLEESGIYNFWRKLIDIEYRPRYTRCNPFFKALSLQSNTVVVFFIFVIGAVISAFVFMGEILVTIKRSLEM
ncbi:unnamed protein product [Orchesella dallaii]|uniref:Uncharacterized protein n=1 Tax=Orchesella dallaii TaxID=48710 RepID=A0ABP1S8L6_9HEXA